MSVSQKRNIFMQLNLTHPSFVIVGAWNPAIFTPPWVARNILGMPEGTQVKVAQISEVIDYQERPTVTYIGDFGYLVFPNKVNFYLNTDDFENSLEDFEKKIIKVLETLSHTPVSAFGVNFNFIIDEETDELNESFESSDKIRTQRKILNEQSTLTLDSGDDVVLNFKKSTEEDKIIIDFNYHHSNFEMNKTSDIKGCIGKLYKESKEILKTCYNLQVDNIVINRYRIEDNEK